MMHHLTDGPTTGPVRRVELCFRKPRDGRSQLRRRLLDVGKPLAPLRLTGQQTFAAAIPREFPYGVLKVHHFPPVQNECLLDAQAHLPFIPSASVEQTSDGTPRMVEVMGATVTADKYAIELSRVSTTTGLCLSGRGN